MHLIIPGHDSSDLNVRFSYYLTRNRLRQHSLRRISRYARCMNNGTHIALYTTFTPYKDDADTGKPEHASFQAPAACFQLHGLSITWIGRLLWEQALEPHPSHCLATLQLRRSAIRPWDVEECSIDETRSWHFSVRKQRAPQELTRTVLLEHVSASEHAYSGGAMGRELQIPIVLVASHTTRSLKI